MRRPAPRSKGVQGRRRSSGWGTGTTGGRSSSRSSLPHRGSGWSSTSQNASSCTGGSSSAGRPGGGHRYHRGRGRQLGWRWAGLLFRRIDRSAPMAGARLYRWVRGVWQAHCSGTGPGPTCRCDRSAATEPRAGDGFVVLFPPRRPGQGWAPEVARAHGAPVAVTTTFLPHGSSVKQLISTSRLGAMAQISLSLRVFLS